LYILYIRAQNAVPSLNGM